MIGKSLEKNRIALVTVPGRDQIGLVTHQDEGFGLGLFRLRQVEVHLVTVEVGVVGGADALVEAEGPVLQDLGPVTHDGDPVERRLTVDRSGH